jgi:hypothetical protein
MALHLFSVRGCEENAFLTSSGNVVVIVLNNNASFKIFNIKLGNDLVKHTSLQAPLELSSGKKI